MSTNFMLVGEVYNTIKVIEYIGDAKYIVKCLNCGNTTVETQSDIEYENIKSCNKCKSFKFDLETSKEIYDKHKYDNITIENLSKEYNCSKPTIRNTLNRIIRLEDTI